MTKKTKGRPQLSKARRKVADAQFERTLEPIDGMDDKIDVGPGPALAQRTAAAKEQARAKAELQVQEAPAPGGYAVNSVEKHASMLSSDLHARSRHPTLAERVQSEGVRAQYGLASTSEDRANVPQGPVPIKAGRAHMSKRKKRRRRGGR